MFPDSSLEAIQKEAMRNLKYKIQRLEGIEETKVKSEPVERNEYQERFRDVIN